MGQTLTTSCGDVRGQHLVSAIREGDVDCLQRMIDDNPKRLNNRLFFDHVTPLHIAASCGQHEVIYLDKPVYFLLMALNWLTGEMLGSQ